MSRRVSEHQDKGLAELIGAIQVTVSLADMVDRLSLLLVKLFKLADTEKGGRVWETDDACNAVVGEGQRARRPSRQRPHG